MDKQQQKLSVKILTDIAEDDNEKIVPAGIEVPDAMSLTKQRKSSCETINYTPDSTDAT